MEILIDYIDELLNYNNGLLYLSNDVANPKYQLNRLLSNTDRKLSYYERFSLYLQENEVDENQYTSIKRSCQFADFLSDNYKRVWKGEIIKWIFSEYSNYENIGNDKKYNFIWDERKCNPIFIENVSSTFKHFKSKTGNTFYYRGHSNYTYQTIPSIYRGNLIRKENSMYRELLIRNPENFDKTKSTFEKLTIMQHHGLPTRLLDITKNPMVAIFFACDDDSQRSMPGEVIFIEAENKTIKYYDSDTVSIISNLGKVERDFEINTYDKEKFNDEYSTLKLLHLIKEEKPYFLGVINPNDLEKAIIVKPINNNDRIKRQQGFFILFGMNKKVLKPTIFEPIHGESKLSRKNRYIIPHEAKKRLLEELEIIGISSDTLFPEIDNGTKYIRDKQ